MAIKTIEMKGEKICNLMDNMLLSDKRFEQPGMLEKVEFTMAPNLYRDLKKYHKKNIKGHTRWTNPTYRGIPLRKVTHMKWNTINLGPKEIT